MRWQREQRIAALHTMKPEMNKEPGNASASFTGSNRHSHAVRPVVLALVRHHHVDLAASLSQLHSGQR